MHRNDNPKNCKRGGVLLYYKESLPIRRRADLEFSETIVCEIKLRKYKIFFAVAYRSPTQTNDEFRNFLASVETLINSINLQSNHILILSGDFNASCSRWWELDPSNHIGESLQQSTEDLG